MKRNKQLKKLKEQKDAIRKRLDVENNALFYMDRERRIVHGNGADVICFLGGYLEFFVKQFGMIMTKNMVNDILEQLEEE